MVISYIHKEDLENDKCLNNHDLMTSVFSGKDYIQAFNSVVKDKKSYTVSHLLNDKFICGHLAKHLDDAYSIAYHSINAKLVLMKKYKYLTNSEFCEAVYELKKLGFKIPSMTLKRYNRILKNIQVKNSSEYILYMSSITHFDDIITNK